MRPRGGVVTAITNDVRFDVFRVFLCSPCRSVGARVANGGRTPRTLQETHLGLRDRHHVRGSSRDARHFGAPRARTSRRTPGRRASPTTPRDRSSPSRRWRVRAWTAPAEEAKEPRLDFFALRPPMKASARVPVLAFAAAFLVSFNVFSNYHDGLLPHVRREDPLTATTASALSILDADASAERAIHDKATAKAAAFHAHYTAGTPTRDDHQRELDHEASHRRRDHPRRHPRRRRRRRPPRMNAKATRPRPRPHPRLHLRPRLRWTLARSAPSNTRSTRVTS